ncbi:MAG: BMP family ABC transporter substrate-binding protein, partial [Conexibacter sp.]
MLAVVGALVMGVVGCGGGDDKPGGTNIALVTPGTRDDVDWTRQTTNAAEAAAKKLHVRAAIVEGSADDPVKPVLRRLARNAQLVVAPFVGDREAAIQVAQSTEVPALVWGDPDALRPGLVGDIEADLAHGAYAAGVIAIHASIERSVGIVLCDDGTAPMTERFALAAAYLAGARSVEPKTKATYVISGSDVASAKLGTLEVVKRGGQMIFAVCGTAAPGVLQGVEQAVKKVETGETQLVGLIGDKGTINKANVVLTSVMVNPQKAIEQAVRDIKAGTFGKRVYTLDLKNGGITLLQTGRTPGDAYQAGIDAPQPAELPTAVDEHELDALI